MLSSLEDLLQLSHVSLVFADLLCGQFICAPEDEELHPGCVEQMWPHSHFSVHFGSVLQVTVPFTHVDHTPLQKEIKAGCTHLWSNMFRVCVCSFRSHCRVTQVHQSHWQPALLFQNVSLLVPFWQSCDGHRFYGLHSTSDPHLCHPQTAWAQDHHCWQNGND